MPAAIEFLKLKAPDRSVSNPGVPTNLNLVLCYIAIGEFDKAKDELGDRSELLTQGDIYSVFN